MTLWLFFWLQQLFAVGDAGALTERQVRAYERFWQAYARRGDVLLLLGDNLYPAGHRGHTRDLRRWQRLVRVAQAFPGSVWATPGNHDWKAGLAGLLRQEKDLPLRPTPGQFGPDTLRHGPWYFLFLDSELYIRAQGEGFSWQRLDSLLSLAPPAAVVVFVLHHPPFTAGAHGGRFPLIAHLFPLRVLSPYLYLPLPGLGTLFIWARKAAKHPTDRAYPAYHQLAESLAVRAQELKQPVLFLSGHDHNLQVHHPAPTVWAIVSGSGCKTEPLARRHTHWGRAVVGLYKLTPTTLEAYALHKPDQPIWKYEISAVP